MSSAIQRLLLTERILRYRAHLRRREQWSREQLLAHQQRALAELRRFAQAHSPFYADFHRGLEARPLSELPVLTKARLMNSFDRVATHPQVRLPAIEEHLRHLQGDELFSDRFWVSATSGSSGRRSIIPSNLTEWATVIASYGRANEWAGMRISPFSPARLAIVSSLTPFHQSVRVGRSIALPLLRTCRLDAGQPLHEITAALSDFQPQILVAYVSMLRALAEEQLAGRLRIAPRHVNCSSEVLTPEARERARAAWGMAPFNVYAATETGGVAAECEQHTGLHLFEDLVIPEVVDDDYRSVAPGTLGSRLLVTVLFSRTLPLIRFELTDRVRFATANCPCGRPFRLLSEIEGRTDDVLHLPGAEAATVPVHPVVFHRVLDLLHAGGWQVRQEQGALRVLVQGATEGLEREVIARELLAALAASGAAPIPILIDAVTVIPAGASGKRPLVVALKP